MGGAGLSTVAVGVIANPASGRDVRRLVTGASVFDNAEKGAMVHRLMAGLGATGVDRVVMMPAGSGVSESLRRHLSGRTGHLAAQRLPELEVLDMALFEDARDSASGGAGHGRAAGGGDRGPGRRRHPPG